MKTLYYKLKVNGRRTNLISVCIKGANLIIYDLNGVLIFDYSAKFSIYNIKFGVWDAHETGKKLQMNYKSL
jgi:hypothetical protein